MLESSVQIKVLNELRKIPFSEWLKPSVTNKAGIQDIIGQWRGYYIAIELKKDDDEGPNTLQTYRIIQTNKKGGHSFWASDWNTIKNNLEQFARTKGYSLWSRDR